MISLRAFIRSTAALCAIMTAGVILAGDGVVRMSDRSASPARTGSGIQQVRHATAGQCGEVCCPPQVCTPSQCWAGPCVQNCGPCDRAVISNGGCGQNMCGNGCSAGSSSGMCQSGTCYTPMDCNSCFSSCDASGMPLCWCEKCSHSPCVCKGSHGSGCENVCLFAGSLDSGTGSHCRDFWHGQSMSFRNKNARLANHLFGWMIPSGCCGQGCPPVGKYGITYADQPDYINPRDTQLYGAQGYGMPITVPLAPNVNQAYNYSSGIPSSRITQIGTYNPNTSAQPLYHQTW